MKRFCFILTIVLLILSFRSYSFSGMLGIKPFHVRFTRLNTPQYNFFFGNPLKVIDIEYFDTQLDKSINKYVHVFKVTILRPSNDDGRGTTKFYGDWYRLYYWAAENKFSPAIAIRNGMRVYQDIDKSNNRYISVYITTGLTPGWHTIRIAVFPYLMFSKNGGNVRDIVTILRHDATSFISGLLTYTGPAAFVSGLAIGKVRDITIDAGLIELSTRFGQTIKFEVPAIVPKITTRYARGAGKLLRQHSLKPQPDYNHSILVNDKRYHKRVAKQRFNPGQLLHAGTGVPYKFYKYKSNGNDRIPVRGVGGREICGDGIDNNGNGIIDEGCYKKSILVDDNKCRDDTIGLIIDGRRYGATPPGKKRHFNIGHLSRGQHRLKIVAVKSGGKPYGCSPGGVVSYKVVLGKGMKFKSGGTYKSNDIKQGKSDVYYIWVP